MFKNLTPHTVNIIVNGENIAIEPEGIVPRVSSNEQNIRDVDGIPIVTVSYGDIQNLPEKEEGVKLIVSKMCCDACPSRDDLFYPTRLVRDEGGRIIGAEALASGYDPEMQAFKDAAWDAWYQGCIDAKWPSNF